MLVNKDLFKVHSIEKEVLSGDNSVRKEGMQ